MGAKHETMEGADNGEKNLFGGFNRRRNRAMDNDRNTKRVQRKNQDSERTTMEAEAGRAEFESIREENLSDKQKRDTAIAKAYGYDLYHVPDGPRFF